MATIFQPRFALRAARAILNDVPVAASWFVTNRCNFSCDFCQYPSFNNDKKRELLPAEFGAIGEKLARAGVLVIAIIGGEPFIRKDLPDIVAALSRNLVVQITTNGWLVDEAAAARVFAAGVHMVSGSRSIRRVPSCTTAAAASPARSSARSAPSRSCATRPRWRPTRWSASSRS